MKLISWNVNGLRACLKKGFEDTFNAAGRGCVLHSGNQNAARPGGFCPRRLYTEYINSAEKKGYSARPDAVRR